MLFIVLIKIMANLKTYALKFLLRRRAVENGGRIFIAAL